MPDGFGGLLTAFQAARDAGKDDGGDEGPSSQPWWDALFPSRGGGAYPEASDHEFEADSGEYPGGVNAEAYCKHCGVTQSMHGGGAGDPNEDPPPDDDPRQAGGGGDPHGAGGAGADPYAR